MASPDSVAAGDVRIRWRDLDACGHVNNAVFLTYVEEIQREWLSAVLAAPSSDADFVTARVAIDFERELRLDDDAVHGECALVRVGHSSITMRIELFASPGARAAQAEVVLVACDRASGQPRPLVHTERTALCRVHRAEDA